MNCFQSSDFICEKLVKEKAFLVYSQDVQEQKYTNRQFGTHDEQGEMWQLVVLYPFVYLVVEVLIQKI